MRNSSGQLVALSRQTNKVRVRPSTRAGRLATKIESIESEANMADQNIGLRQLQDRWQYIFSTLAAGGEVAPSLRLRTEGMMETLVLLGHAGAVELQQKMAACRARPGIWRRPVLPPCGDFSPFSDATWPLWYCPAELLVP